MTNQNRTYFFIGITVTSNILFPRDSLRNDTHSWSWGRCIWRYQRIILSDDRETVWDIV